MSMVVSRVLLFVFLLPFPAIRPSFAQSPDEDDSTTTEQRLKRIEQDYESALQQAEAQRTIALQSLVRQLTREKAFEEAERVQALLGMEAPPPTAAQASPEIDHPAAREYLAALEAYQDAVHEFETARLAEFESRIDRAAEKGELKEVQKLRRWQEQQNRDAFASVDDPALQRILTRLGNRLQRPQFNLERARNTAIDKMIRTGAVNQANQVMQSAMEALQVHRRWKVLFLGTDSKTWNTTSDQWNSWARPLSEASEDMHFLRLRRLDTGDFIIIPLDKSHLGERFLQGPIGWGGDGFEHEDITHFGIFRTDFTADQKGSVVVGRNGFTPYTGWGFGHRHNVRDAGLTMAWQGQPIPTIPLEIAITTTPLNNDENRKLLFQPR